ncbi:unnamed protein product [Durusdinium trenchii]|uniref:Uncharacterized protein n=1 Tax=Durusdinium trenchii TaxID=1381693 RepID=A0ABP0I714_9DINO
MCLVRMLSCGNRSLAERCGSLLAEWVDATAEELHDRIDSMSEARSAARGALPGLARGAQLGETDSVKSVDLMPSENLPDAALIWGVKVPFSSTIHGFSGIIASFSTDSLVTRRFQLVQGIKSVNERPMVWEPGKARRVGGAATPHSSSLRIEASWYILTALSKFGPSTLYERMVSPWRARVLRPFLPVLCREPKEVLGTRGCCRAVSARVCRGGGEWT